MNTVKNKIIVMICNFFRNSQADGKLLGVIPVLPFVRHLQLTRSTVLDMSCGQSPGWAQQMASHGIVRPERHSSNAL